MHCIGTNAVGLGRGWGYSTCIRLVFGLFSDAVHVASGCVSYPTSIDVSRDELGEAARVGLVARGRGVYLVEWCVFGGATAHRYR